MTNALINLVAWALGHETTITALAFVFLIGSVWGMWIEFSNHDHGTKKESQSAGTR